MATFDCYDTEQYYYETLRKLGVLHVSWSNNMIITRKDIDEFKKSITGESSWEDRELESETFYDFP